jgi:hypothetical protein
MIEVLGARFAWKGWFVTEAWWILVAVGAVAAVSVLIWRPLRAAAREARFAQARRDFHRQRERLEVKFIQLASANAAPDSPDWEDCDFDDDVAYVRNRSTGELSAFVGVTVAVGDYEGPPNGIGDLIGNLRAGTAVFRFDGDHWETDGRAILNLSPAEAIRFYRNDLEMIDQEPAEQS